MKTLLAALLPLLLGDGDAAAMPQRSLADAPYDGQRALPVLGIAHATSFEGDSASHVMVFTVRLSEPVLPAVRFHYETLDGTATIGDADYLPASGDVVIAPGDTLAHLEVTVLGDSLLEANERFLVRISLIENATPGDTLATGTLLGDERARFVSIATGIPDFGPGTLAPSWGDADGDGLPDLPMYGNTGGDFAEMPGFRQLLGDGNYHGGAWCDFDRDGDMDLVLMPYGDSTSSSYNRVRLFENAPSGFLDVAAALGMDITGRGETPVWADFDADGWPDLFLPFYSHVFPFRSYLFLNNRDGTFTEFADSAGVALPGLPIELRPEGACAADWNGDGAIDLYCASHLFLNAGGGRFRDVAAQVGLPVVFDEGAQFVDHDDDGDLDLYLRTGAGPTLFRNDGGAFTDVSASFGIGPLDWLWGDRWADFDLDGDLDLVFFDPTGPPRLLLAGGDGTFAEDTSFRSVGLIRTLCAFADIDADGDPDLVVGEYTKQFVRNLLEQVPRSRTPCLKVRVEDAEGRLVGHGSTVRLRALDDPKRPVQTRIVDGGSGYLGQDEYTLTFGGVGTGSFDLEVSFPGEPGAPVVVGPAQNPLLAGIRPGDGPPRTYVVRRNHEVTLEPAEQPERPWLREPRAATSGEASVRGPVLASADPNPARQGTRLAFTLPVPGWTTLAVFDVSGRRVRKLLDGPFPAGPESVTWDLRDQAGRPVRAGLYFLRLVHDGHAAVMRRAVVLR